jgi:putative restriction endonuclease
MTFGVFIHRSDSIYDDRPAERYQFPPQYLDRARPCVGDWIIYFEPMDVPRTRGYFAVARVQEVIPDPGTPRRYLAIIEPGSYLEFPNKVPARVGGAYVEREAPNRQWSVRPLSPSDFNRIVTLGLAEDAELLPRIGEAMPASLVQDERAPFVFEQERDRVAALTSRPVRDRAFRRVVLKAYDERCAITGLKLINGGGRAEVEAAHIRPVEANGPDSVQNGLALSGTVHWMFDRGLIALSDDLDILVSRQVNDADGIWGLVNKSRRALPPVRAADRPHPHFLAWHRSQVFKQ